MGHNLEQLGTASLDTMGGLYAQANPQDLPEGASPRTYDTDFIVGSVFTRPGLVSIYTYTNTLNITKVIIGSGNVGMFSYNGATIPVINEGFLLQGFTGAAEFLNDQVVYVLATNTMLGIFTAVVVGPSGAYINLSGTAISTVGQFVGPNAPTVAVNAVLDGVPWSNPGGILGDTSYASVASSGLVNSELIPEVSVNDGSGTTSNPAWSNPSNVTSTSSLATVVLTSSPLQLSSVDIVSTGLGLELPSNAVIEGLSISLQSAFAFSGTTTGNQGPLECSVSSGVGWSGSIASGGSASIVVNPGTQSSLLTGSSFGFNIPTTATITGISATVTASTINGANQIGTLILHLTLGGEKAQLLTSSPVRTTYGGSTDLWSIPSVSVSQINSSSFGIELQGSAPVSTDPPHFVAGTADITVSDVVLTVYYNNGGASGNASVSLQLTQAGTAIGSVTSFALTNSLTTYVAGSPFYLWGTALTPSVVNDPTFGVLIGAQSGVFEPNTSYTIDANNLQFTLYYSVTGTDGLQAKAFNFSIQPTNGVTGLETTYQAYSSSSNTLTFQLIKNGVAVGVPKVQTITTTPTIYSLGGGSDLWGTTWSYSDINSVGFGWQVTSSGSGTAFINDVDMLVFITPGLADFNYIKSYIQNNERITTLALDSLGNMWGEDVTDLPGIFSLESIYITPGTYAKSATSDNQEYIVFSNLSVGTDRPRVASINSSDEVQFLPLSQIGPGAPPSFTASLGNGINALVVTAYSIVSGVATFTFNAVAGFTPSVGSLYLISGTGNTGLDGNTFIVLGTPAPTSTTFSVSTIAVGSGSGLSAEATPAYSYSISSITQPAAAPFNGQILLWSAGPSSTTPGTTLTFFYGGAGQAENPGILTAFNSNNPCIVYITGVPAGAPGNGTWLVTSHGIGVPPSETLSVPFFTVTYTSSNYQRYGGPGGSGPNGPGNDGNFQITLATIDTNTFVADLSSGDTIQITGATPAGWNSSWTVQSPLKSATLNITSSAMSSGGVATYGYTITSTPAVSPVNGQLVTTSNLTNAAVFNTTGVMSNVTGSTFQISGFPAGNAIPQAVEDGQAVTFGTSFTFDPGTNDVGTTTPSPIFGNDTGTGLLSVVGSSIVPIGAGTRQGVVFFITESGYETAASAPAVFTTSEDANFIFASNLPIGPPNVIARGIAFTEAGQNGVPGANFYVIPNPVTITVGNTSTTYTATIVQDNTTTSAKFSFTDAVLLKSQAIDIQGNDLFNLVELGSSAWCLPYAGRMFYGLQLNKINNWTSGGGLTFDGGYLSNGVNGSAASENVVLLGGPYANLQPLGWNIGTAVDQTLVTSPIAGQSLYIKDTYPGTTAKVGLIWQTAYRDPYQVAIINPNTEYSVRVTAECPSGVNQGTLVIDLTDYNPGIGFGQTYGAFSVPLISMTSNMQVFVGALLTTPFTTGVSQNLQIRMYVQNMGYLSDCLVDRVEVFPTAQPYILAQVYGSYADDLEAIDASGSGGIIDTTSENPQACLGGFVMHDEMYLLKLNSWYATQDNPNSEPGGWSLREISNRVGTCGINAYDTGEEWAVTACREGIYGFNGGQPVKLMQELWNLWETINWEAGSTIWLRNDIVNKRILCAVPLPTGTNPVTGVPTATTLWLPNSPYNPAPVSPNVMLMLNYQAFATFDEMAAGAPAHSTMFGTLAAPDMRRKWSIWQIPSPYADFITRQDGLDQPLFIGNGIDSSKIYRLDNNQKTDDGVAIDSLYCTYGFTNATKSTTIPILGMHRKQFSVFQTTIEGAGNASVTLYPDTLGAKYPYVIPGGINLSNPAMQDAFRPLNVVGNRLFVENRTNAVGSWFNLDKLLLTGRSAPYSNLNPLGGMNRGIVAGAT